MKHMLLTLIVIVCGYILYNFTPDTVRKESLKKATPHILFFIAIVIVLFTIISFAVYFPASSLI